MNGILIYTNEKAKKNEFAISLYKEKLGVGLRVAGELQPEKEGLPAFVINRTNDEKIAMYYEARGVRVFNPAALTALANDKKCAYEFMAANGIPCLPIGQNEVPLVAKPRFGSGGEGVRLITKKEDIPQTGDYVLQRVASEPGKDLRVYMLGGKIALAVLRENKGDFRANLAQGGTATKYTLSAKERALAQKTAALLKYDFIGIDFLFDGGNLVFNEIEDSVGARAAYMLGRDIIGEYCEYIKAKTLC